MMKLHHKSIIEKLANMIMLAAGIGWLVWALIGGHGDADLIGSGACIAAAAAGAAFVAKMAWRAYAWR